MFSFKKADITEIPAIQAIANATWPVAYGNILKEGQLDYMLSLMYSASALEISMNEDESFYFVYADNELAGFASFGWLDNERCKLHKLYVLPNHQGNGAGHALLEFVIRKVSSLGASQLVLNVNKNNPARFFYKKNGL